MATKTSMLGGKEITIDDNAKMVTPQQAAVMLGVSVKTIFRMIKLKQLKSRLLCGQCRRISRASIDRLVKCQ